MILFLYPYIRDPTQAEILVIVGRLRKTTRSNDPNVQFTITAHFVYGIMSPWYNQPIVSMKQHVADTIFYQ